MPTCTALDSRRPVREYGCTTCQAYHREGLDDLYGPHIMRQSKHGMYERAPRLGEVFARLVSEETT